MAHEKSDVEKIRGLIKGIRIAMLTTVDEDGALRSRPMATQQTEFDGDLWFFTSASSPKVEEIERDREVNVCYAVPDDNTFISLSGTARLVRDKAKIEDLWNPILKAWFPKGLDDPELALLKVEVGKAEYWDLPSGKMIQLAGFVKAIVTGRQVNPGEHEKVDLKESAASAGAGRG